MPGLIAQIFARPVKILKRSRAGSVASISATGTSETERRLSSESLARAIDRALAGGRCRQAEELGRLADAIEPKGPHLTERLARLRLIAAEPESAIALIDNCPHESGPLRLLRAASLVQLGGTAHARRDLQEWVSTATAPPGARVLLALLDWEAGDLHAATLAILRNRPHLEDPRSLEILLLIAVAQDRREQARVWSRRLDAYVGADSEDAALSVLRRSFELPEGPSIMRQSRSERIAVLARELRGAEPVIPALVEAQRLDPVPETALLLERAIELALGELSDSATAFEALGRLSLIRGDLEAAHTWTARGLADHPMSVALALLDREIDAAVPGGEGLDIPDVLASIGGADAGAGDSPFADFDRDQERAA